MLELGQSQTPGTGAGDLIKDGTEASFMADVIEGSRETPVIVDFWATWCGPCKTLGPMLEAAVMAAKGKVRMIKIDVDKEQRSPVRWRSRVCRFSPSRRSSPSKRRTARGHVPGSDPAEPDRRVREQACRDGRRWRTSRSAGSRRADAGRGCLSPTPRRPFARDPRRRARECRRSWGSCEVAHRHGQIEQAEALLKQRARRDREPAPRDRGRARPRSRWPGRPNRPGR